MRQLPTRYSLTTCLFAGIAGIVGIFGCGIGGEGAEPTGSSDAGSDAALPLRESSLGGYSEVKLREGRQVIRGRFETQNSWDIDKTPLEYATIFLDRWGGDLGIDRANLGEPELQDLGTRLVIVDYPVVHEGVPVVDAVVRLHLADYVVTRAIIRLPDSYPDTSPVVESDVASALAKQLTGAPDTAEPTATQLAIILPKPGGIGPNEPRLAWVVTVPSDGPLVGGEVRIDAVNGEVLGVSRASAGARERVVKDVGNTTDLDAATLVYNEEGPIDGVTPSADAEQAFLNALLVHDYYSATFERPDAPIEAFVHYGHPDIANAFASDGKMYFGDGFVTEDIFAHEYGHLVIDAESDLIYGGESSSVHEALADLMAMLGNRRADWHLGPDDRTLEGFRDIERPSTPTHYDDRKSLGIVGPCDESCGSTTTCRDATGLCIDGCEVTTCSAGECWELPHCNNDEGYAHENSTIITHAVYLATRAGAVTEFGQGEPIGELRMEQIVYETIRNEVDGLMGLEATAESMVDACERFAIFEPLFGRAYTHGIMIEDCATLRNVFADAGLTEADSDFDGWIDGDDNCLEDPNSDQLDSDNDGRGDACDVDATRLSVEVQVYNDSHLLRDFDQLGWHILVGEERPSAETWLEPGESRSFWVNAYVGQVFMIRMVNEDGVEDDWWDRNYCTIYESYGHPSDVDGQLPHLRVEHGPWAMGTKFTCKQLYPPSAP